MSELTPIRNTNSHSVREALASDLERYNDIHGEEFYRLVTRVCAVLRAPVLREETVERLKDCVQEIEMGRLHGPRMARLLRDILREIGE